MTFKDEYAPRQLYDEIIDAKPRCIYEPNDYIEDNPSEEWATLICQDCQVLRQCRKYGDTIENWRTNPAYLGAVYAGETPKMRSRRRRALLKAQHAAIIRAT